MSGYSQSNSRRDVVPFSQLRPSSAGASAGSSRTSRANSTRQSTGRSDSKGNNWRSSGQKSSDRNRQQSQQVQQSQRPTPRAISTNRVVPRRQSSERLIQDVRQEPWRAQKVKEDFSDYGGYDNYNDGYENRYEEDRYEDEYGYNNDLYETNRRPRVRRGGNDDRYFEGFDSRSRRGQAELKPESGWRALLYKTFGVNVGVSDEDRHNHELLRLLKMSIDENTVAIFSRKGGVGKTTITAYLGATLAAHRGGRIVALDGDAEAGSLGWLLAPRAPSTLPELASADPAPRDYRELREFTASTNSGVDVIVGEPAENGIIDEHSMQHVVEMVSEHYDVALFDTGAGVTRATGRVLVHSARVLLLVMGPSVDSVRAAERTLAWLDENPGAAAHRDAQVIAVINGIPSDAPKDHIERIESHFVDRCAEVVRIPWDRYLSTGATDVNLDQIQKETRAAFVELAAATVRALSGGRRKKRMRRAS